MPNNLFEDFAALVAMDWSDQKHDYALTFRGEKSREKGSVKNRPEELTELINSWQTRFPEGRIAVCLEQSRGSLIYFLMQFDFIVLYPINPAMVKNYRKAFYPSGAKGDPCDADLMLDLLEYHRDRLRRWDPPPVCVRKLDLLNQHRRRVVESITSLTNQLTAYLKAYYPQALNMAGELDTLQACDFLEKWPNIESLKKAEPLEIEKFYYSHRCRRRELIAKRIKLIESAISITSDEAICQVYQMSVITIVAQLRSLLLSLKQFDRQLQETFKEFPEKDFYAVLPGAGPILQPRLAVLFGLDRSRFESAAEIQTFSGVAPVTEESGNNRWVHWRYACPKFIRQSLIEFANHSRNKSIWAKTYYEWLRKIGKSHQAALRALAFKWLRILFRCWKDGISYNEKTYIIALKKRNSPLLKLIA
jgi:transposase